MDAGHQFHALEESLLGNELLEFIRQKFVDPTNGTIVKKSLKV
jgi:hypothetical protein